MRSRGRAGELRCVQYSAYRNDLVYGHEVERPLRQTRISQGMHNGIC